MVGSVLSRLVRSLGISARCTSFTKRQQPASWPVRKVEGISMMTRTAITRTSIGACVWHCLSVLLLSRGDSNIRILVTAAAFDVHDWNHFSRPRPPPWNRKYERECGRSSGTTWHWCSTRTDCIVASCAVAPENARFSPGTPISRRCRVSFKNCGHVWIFPYAFGHFTRANSNMRVLNGTLRFL